MSISLLLTRLIVVVVLTVEFPLEPFRLASQILLTGVLL